MTDESPNTPPPAAPPSKEAERPLPPKTVEIGLVKKGGDESGVEKR
jgi:hypothetical protein